LEAISVRKCPSTTDLLSQGYLLGEVFSRDKKDSLGEKADSFWRARGKYRTKPTQRYSYYVIIGGEAIHPDPEAA